jgi:hypothetical protein
MRAGFLRYRSCMPRLDPFAPLVRKQRDIPFDFVLERLEPLGPTTRAMFGSTGVYLGERVVFILRKKGDSDDGVWVCFEPEVEAEVAALLPALQHIDVLGNVRSWRKLAASHASFEDDVLYACKLLLAGDTRLGKLPDRLKAKHRAAAKQSMQPKPVTKAKPKARAAKVTQPKAAKARPTKRG